MGTTNESRDDTNKKHLTNNSFICLIFQNQKQFYYLN